MERCDVIMNKNSKRPTSPAVRAFFRAMLFTAAAIALVIIGYFTAGYFSGGL